MIWSLKTIIVGTVTLAALGGGLLLFFGGREPLPELDRLPNLVYTRVVERIASEVQAPAASERLLIPPIARDPQDALRARIARSVEDRRGLEVQVPKREELGAESDVLAVIGAQVRDWKKRIVAEWTGDKPDLVLVASVRELQNDDDRIRLSVEWQQQKMASGEPLAGGELVEEIPKSLFNMDYSRARIADSSGTLRVGIWLAVLIVPPLLLLTFVKRVLREESNLHNALMVLAFAVPGCVAAWILTAFGAGWMGGGLTLLATAVSVAYSFFFCTAVEELRR